MHRLASVLLMGMLVPGKHVHAPLPSEAYGAKTIAIVNHTGTQTVTDRAYEELETWGRFQITSDPSQADIVLVIGMEQQYAGSRTQTYGDYTYTKPKTVVDVTISFFLNGKTEPFFSETEEASLFRKSATKRCIDDFRKRIEEVQSRAAPKP